MRVLFVNPLSELGGSERSLLDVLASLGKAVPEIERRLLLFADGELAARARDLGVGVEIEQVPQALGTLGESSASRAALGRAPGLALGLLGAPAFLLGLRRRIVQAAPDLVHTNGMKAHILVAAAASGLPRVVHLRDFAGARPLSRRLLPWLGRRAIVVANSRAVADDALGVAPGLTTRVVYNGIDLEEFRPGPRDPSYLSHLAGLPAPANDALAIGLVATYAWWKGHRRFLESAAELRALAPERALRFYVIGGPIYRTSGSEVTTEALADIVRERGLGEHVGFVPFQRDAAAAYRGLDIVVHASERPEPFGRTIVEAMASGRAVVAARAGGAAELVRHGETALAYAPDAPGELARAMLGLVRDDALRERLGRAARLEAEARFDRSRLGPELAAVYRELLGAPAAAR